MKKERESVSKVGETETREITKLKDELTKSKANLADIESKLATSQKSQKNLEDKLKKTEADSKNDKLNLEKKKGELEIELQVSNEYLVAFLVFKLNYCRMKRRKMKS